MKNKRRYIWPVIGVIVVYVCFSYIGGEPNVFNFSKDGRFSYTLINLFVIGASYAFGQLEDSFRA